MTDSDKLMAECQAEMDAALQPFIGRADFGPETTKEIMEVLAPIAVKYRMKGLKPPIEALIRGLDPRRINQPSADDAS